MRLLSFLPVAITGVVISLGGGMLVAAEFIFLMGA